MNRLTHPQPPSGISHSSSLLLSSIGKFDFRLDGPPPCAIFNEMPLYCSKIFNWIFDSVYWCSSKSVLYQVLFIQELVRLSLCFYFALHFALFYFLFLLFFFLVQIIKITGINLLCISSSWCFTKFKSTKNQQKKEIKKIILKKLLTCAQINEISVGIAVSFLLIAKYQPLFTVTISNWRLRPTREEKKHVK